MKSSVMAACIAGACVFLSAQPQPITAFTGVTQGVQQISSVQQMRARKATCLQLRAEEPWPSRRQGSQRSEGAEDEFGNELALRIMISRNIMARETADRAYIPMDVAVRWARRLNLWGSKEKWEEWIEDNKHRNPFIPPNPEEYYTARGVWLGWRYWLGEGYSP